MTKEELLKEAEEKYIERLKQDGYNVEYRNETYNDGYLDSAEPREKRIAEFEKEIAELKESYCLRRCKHCEFLHENGNCLKVGGYFTAVDNKYCPLLKDKVELIKENAELKKRMARTGTKATDEGYARTLQTIQLTKAKEIIKDYMIIVKGGNITVCSVPEENRCINVLKLNEQVEQFLKEVENALS